MHTQSIFWKICDSHDLVRLCVSVCVTFVSRAHILVKTKKVKQIRLNIMIFAIE